MMGISLVLGFIFMMFVEQLADYMSGNSNNRVIATDAESLVQSSGRWSNLKKTCSFCNIIFVILSCFHLTIFFGITGPSEGLKIWSAHPNFKDLKALHITRIKYYKASESGNPPSLNHGLRNIGILCLKQATLGKHFDPVCTTLLPILSLNCELKKTAII